MRMDLGVGDGLWRGAVQVRYGMERGFYHEQSYISCANKLLLRQLFGFACLFAWGGGG